MISFAYRLTLQTPEQCKPWLTAAEWQYSQGLNAKRQAEFNNGRTLARRILMKNNLLTIADIAIDLPSENAPRLIVQHKLMKLSISHSGTAIAVALSDQPIGLDIEQIKCRDIKALTEQLPAMTGVTTLQQFYQRWTGCEAYSKYSANSIWQILQRPLPKQISLYYLPLSDYMLCLCYRNSDVAIQNIGELQ